MQAPDWSPDGKYLSYVRKPDRNSSRDSGFVIHHLATGEVREIRPALTSFVWPRWAPDSRSLTVSGIDLKGRRGIYRVDAQTGEVSVLVPEGGLFRVQWSPDGQKLYYMKAGFAERNMASGEERTIISVEDCTWWPEVSPDGRYVACRTEDPSTKEWIARLFPVAGGEPRELFRAGRIAPTMTWLPDSSSVLAMIGGSAGPEFWLLPVG